ncbi:MAG: glycosyltransferase family 87 protein [Tatlockia sp.]|jgi:hypothetical protein
MNSRTQLSVFFFAFLLILYSLVFCLVFTDKRIVDFIPFYASSQALIDHENPYPVQEKISANLNPPFFLLFFKPLAQLEYHTALASWTLLSLFLGLIGATIAFRCAFSDVFLKKNGFMLYLSYFAFFPILMDISIVQIGSILFFFVMAGYHFYLKERDYYAGILWGIIISIKFFPALLFFYAFKQQRLKVCYVMFGTVFLCCLLPLLLYGFSIYQQYFSMVARILWYGDSWNASLYGFLFRQLIDTRIKSHNLLPVETLFGVLFFIVVAIYYLRLGPKKTQVNHQPFCLTITAMLFLSPFGWIYYFSLLTLPLSLLIIRAFEPQRAVIFLITLALAFFLINFPQAYIVSRKMSDPLTKLSLFSFPFYGLLLINLLLLATPILHGNNTMRLQQVFYDEPRRNLAWAMLIIFGFGLVVPLNSFLIRISIPLPTYKAKYITFKNQRNE